MAAVGLRLMTREGSFINVIVEEQVASNITQLFLEGKLPDRIGTFNVKCLPPSPLWALRVDELFAVHSFVLDGQGTMPAQNFGPNPWSRSGL